MPLSPAEQAELDALEAEVGPKQPAALSQSEAAELASLESELGAESPVAGNIRSEARAQLEESFPRQLARGAVEAIPLATGIAGGALGFASPVPGGALAGAGLGAGFGKAAELALKQQFFPEDQAPDPASAEGLKEIGKETILGAAGEGAGLVVSKLAAPMLKGFANLTKTGQKANAPAIREAAKRLGIKPTTGMLSDSPIIQGLESSLYQSPTVGGSLVRRGVKGVQTGLQKSADTFDVAQNVLSRFETGEALKTGIAGEVGERVGQAQILYDALEDRFKDVAVSDRIKKIATNRIAKLPGARVATQSPSAALSKRVSSELSGISSLEDARFLRTEYGKQLKEAVRQGKFSEADVLGEAYDALTRLRDHSIKQKIFANTGQRDAMLKTIKEADKIYANFSKDGREIAKFLGMKYQTPNVLVESIQEIPSEKLADKIFNLGNYKASKRFQELFPDAFNAARDARINDIIEKSSTRGEIAPSKLVKNLSKIGPEARELMFGKDHVQIFEDMKTVLNAVPERIGPSGTPQGMEFVDILNPVKQGASLGKFGLYKGAGGASRLLDIAARGAARPGVGRAVGVTGVRLGARED